MLIDEVSIHVASGKGGDGAVHFRHEKYVPFGGPDGGDGGRGGDVIFEVQSSLNTLSDFQHQTRFKAADGGRGGSNKKTGKSGADLIIPVPPGTIIYSEPSGEVLGDLVEAGQRLLVARGGRGGRGNPHFANSRNQAPRVAERGEPGQEFDLRLELKLIADVGLIGAPNAGKSTFLAAVTKARPKIAPYPFTTLEPNLGVAEINDKATLVLADIPGLIEGAHLGIGLGHAFLRHIQRTRVLIHLLDALADDPLLDFAQINSELALFDPGLAEKPQLVAVNKLDLPEALERWPQIEAEIKRRGYEVTGISALARQNLRPLLNRALQLLSEAPAEAPASSIPVYRLETDPRAFEISHSSRGWRVSGAAIERAAAMTYWEYPDSRRRFQRIMETLGVDEALRAAGVQAGDTVQIGKYELEWTE
jgi:GTP-binding protein